VNFTRYCQGILITGIKIPITSIITAAENANDYIKNLDRLFHEIGFSLFEVLGQRNLSGVIGEIFSRFLTKDNKQLLVNPHPDGRPDILCVSNKRVNDYLQTCFNLVDGKKIPIRSMLAPFKFGGLEVKCTIGDQNPPKNSDIFNGFYIGLPRVEYLSSLNWWAHHSKSSSLLGLYYDYSEKHNGIPQIMAGFFGELGVENWTKLSLGRAENKKTSNTSLNKSGKRIMMNNLLFIINEPKYISALKNIGCNFSNK